MHAIAVPKQQFSLTRRYYHLDAHESAEISITYSSLLENESLPEITFDLIEGITIKFGEWQILKPADPSIRSAARYLRNCHISVDRQFPKPVAFPLQVGNLQQTQIYTTSTPNPTPDQPSDG